MLDDQSFFTALPLGFGMLHLILFAAMPRLRSNLFYGLFLVFMAATIYFDFQHMLVHGEPGMVLLRFQRASLALGFLFGVRFFYEVFLGQPPRHHRYLAGAYVATGMLAVIEPNDLFVPLMAAMIIGMGDCIRAFVTALREGRQDVWLIGAGFVVFAVFASYDMLLDFGLMSPYRGIHNAYHYGLVGLFVGTSSFLARDVARTQELLVAHERLVLEQEVERRVLQAETDRVRQELEDARVLQLAMLPSSLPQPDWLEVAAEMRTAMEVGGDYYDVRPAGDGTFTFALGDATGHGVRAGTMVAMVKSLFHGLEDEESLPAFFERCTGVLKPMRLGNLFMGLTIVRARPGRLTVAAAGMPPVLVYRAAAACVETIVHKGMPLGAFTGFEYREEDVSVAPGDVALLMSDGLEELFSASREMFGLERAAAALREAGDRPAGAIIEHLTSVAEAWRGDVLQEDDIALMVLRFR